MRIFSPPEARLEFFEEAERYKLPYAIEQDHIYVISVAHQHREPNYWADRIKPA
jgi:hypothetical protein